MLNLNKTPIMAIVLVANTLHAYASDSINVMVKTTENKVAAIGFSVDNKELGGLGNSYKGKGPKNKEYSFGYLYSIWGERIRCGSLVLNEDSTVTLIKLGTICTSVLG